MSEVESAAQVTRFRSLVDKTMLIEIHGSMRREILRIVPLSPDLKSRDVTSNRVPAPADPVLDLDRPFERPAHIHILSAIVDRACPVPPARLGKSESVRSESDEKGATTPDLAAPCIVTRLGILRVYDGAKTQSKEAVSEGIAAAFEAGLRISLKQASKHRQSPKAAAATSRVFLNDRHWHTLSVWIPADVYTTTGKRPIIMAINSTNEARVRPLRDIREQYVANGCLTGVKLALCRLKLPAPLPMLYGQGLQYGNQGCGFACALNEHFLVRGWTTDDRKTAFGSDAWVRPGDRRTRRVTTQLHVDGETIAFEEDVFDKDNSIDRSLRVGLSLEASLRCALFCRLSRMRALAREIRAEIDRRSSRRGAKL